ncbi:stage II sporulation protein M [Endozoicomonas sp. SM1973]|uniref:Stage II sporulation protein M n=1 Tax=Spartinivicinus marinus TaxID=2994442 RepID=A0A853I8G5_9GAMM|nr:stage II sporulation protein M [Spartinivicinus marinus]MCX4028882.1 stage II sporulation protein M [Spartinivicinus marinus]NYZ65535.1 stage II sporulation protein M [Spartinivicinus marinus]
MKQETFENRYQHDWQAFEALLEQLEKRQSPSVVQFASHYRRICHYLALAKARTYSPQLQAQLESMVLRGHQQLYNRRTQFLYNSIQFIVLKFPALLRENWRFFWLATALFYLPGLVIFLAIQWDPNIVYTIMNPHQVTEYESMYDPALRHLGRERQSDTDIFMFGFYIWNNVGIAFKTFAGGILFTIGSLFFLLFNGVFFGAFASHIVNVGYQSTFFPFVVGHGAFELTAITIAGAAGIKMGYSLLAPGNLSRLDALKQSTKVAVQLLLGAAFLLVIAAFVEAFWSSSTLLTPTIKYIVGGLFWLVVAGYLTQGGKGYAT